MALCAFSRHAGHGEGCVRNAALSRSRAKHLPIFLERFLRLVYRMDQAGINWRESRESDHCVEKSFCGIRRGASAASSGDAVSDRGALASVAAACRSEV